MQVGWGFAMSKEAEAVVEAIKAFSTDDVDRAKLLIKMLASLAVVSGWQVEVMADLAESMLEVEEQIEQAEMDERVLQ